MVVIEDRVDDGGAMLRQIAHQIGDGESCLVKEGVDGGFAGHESTSKVLDEYISAPYFSNT
jgi:hypothetical protein